MLESNNLEIIKESNEKKVPSYEGSLRSHMIKIPECISACSGIRVFGRRIKSLVFTTDVAIIRNINADAVMAVYPFTPQPVITRAVMDAADMPVFAGVGGGVTRGARVVHLANDAEQQGAFGVVVNAPTSNLIVKMLHDTLQIPVVVTVTKIDTDIKARLNAGTDIINVAGGAGTAQIVKKIRDEYPDVPIIATGGLTDQHIIDTIKAGANAITFTPPSSGELFSASMEKYRE